MDSRPAPRRSGPYLILCFALGFAAISSAADFHSGEDVELSGKPTDNLFAAGGNIRADFDSSDDVFIAGGDIDYRARTKEDLFLAGGELNLSAPRARLAAVAGGTINLIRGTLRELVIAGGNIDIQSVRIEDDLVLAGGQARADSDTEIAGSATIMAGKAVINSAVRGDTLVSGGEVTLGGQFGGNVRVDAESLVITANSVIQGDLTHSARQVNIEPGARIVGKTIVLEPDREWQRGPGVIGALASVLGLIGMLLIPPVVAAMFPASSRRGRDQIRAKPWETLGKGCLAALAVPFTLALLFISFLGAPLGLAAIPFLLAAGIFAWSVSIYTVGDWLRARLKGRTTRGGVFAWTAVGSLLVSVALMVPLLNVLIWLVAFLAGWGALFESGRASWRASRQASSGDVSGGQNA